MAKMIETLYGIAPCTTERFLAFLMQEYGMNDSEYEQKTLQGRFKAINKYFGYSLSDGLGWTNGQIIEKIKLIFSEYEELLVKYPDGVPDKLKILADMSNEQKDIYIEKNFKRETLPSLYNCIVSYVPSRTKYSLCDAIIDRVLTQLEVSEALRIKKEEEDEIYWNNVFRNFNRDEIPPF